ncbi:hypothetical protein COD89_10935 [Bacillus thuringiensis]|nr:hypothetical protein CON12_28025 [Bacillus thuringiensis]PER49271.1 hypothetical protein CN486_29710 [Bacillus thuringiensis]PFF53553.1 hypothetical protein CN334_29610 [Bacillus thuringiensis]PGV59159.1 hypothetical protein COD89_10935 [Bacillus thuringiensis]
MVHHILQIIVCLLFLNKFLHLKEVNIMVCIPSIVHQKASPKVYKTPHHPHFIILAKKTPSSRSVKGHSPVSRWEMNWLRTRDGRKPS